MVGLGRSVHATGHIDEDALLALRHGPSHEREGTLAAEEGGRQQEDADEAVVEGGLVRVRVRVTVRVRVRVGVGVSRCR